MAPAIRLSAAQRDQRDQRDQEVPEAVRPYVEKVRREAYKVTDADIAALRDAGYSEDQIFELTVSTALGAGMHRLDAAMEALRQDQAARGEG